MISYLELAIKISNSPQRTDTIVSSFLETSGTKSKIDLLRFLYGPKVDVKDENLSEEEKYEKMLHAVHS